MKKGSKITILGNFFVINEKFVDQTIHGKISFFFKHLFTQIVMLITKVKSVFKYKQYILSYWLYWINIC